MTIPPHLSQPEATPVEDRLDALLARQPVSARPDFAAAVRARLDAEDSAADLATAEGPDELDAKLDALLMARPAAPTADFARRTLAATRADGLAPRARPAPLLMFPSLPRWVPALSAFAALVALAFLAPKETDRETPVAVATVNTPVAVAGLTDEAWRLEWELLALGDGLDGVEVLLDDETLLVLSLLTEE